MKKDKRESPVLYTWLKCPVCERRDYRYRVRTDDYLCKVCGTVFHVSFAENKVWKSVRHHGQPNKGEEG